MEANALKSKCIEKAREAGASGGRSNTDIIGSEMRGQSDDILSSLPKQSGMQDILIR